ncbi:hypothetical protein [Streptomyces monomycini]|uniref:hypothetical protein n=1 Tax=Streptomyces monomycini TaxID=371720 RepID=UPI001EECC245|nr:hypothetical protein [Streptomyces monomycini]
MSTRPIPRPAALLPLPGRPDLRDRAGDRRIDTLAAHPLRLGPLEQSGRLLSITPARTAPWSRFGGITINGLLSQAFLAQYAWTLDFDRFAYTFRPPPP